MILTSRLHLLIHSTAILILIILDSNRNRLIICPHNLIQRSCISLTNADFLDLVNSVFFALLLLLSLLVTLMLLFAHFTTVPVLFLIIDVERSVGIVDLHRGPLVESHKGLGHHR